MNFSFNKRLIMFKSSLSFKLVNFSTCGKAPSCSSYFKLNKYLNLTGLKYQDSWVYNLTVGLNEINITSNTTYKQGTMVLLKIINGSIGLANQSYTAINISDAYIQGNETRNFSLKFVNQTQSTVYFQVIVVIDRYSYSNYQTYSKQFNVSGNYSVNLTLFDPATSIIYSQNPYMVNGNKKINLLKAMFFRL